MQSKVNYNILYYICIADIAALMKCLTYGLLHRTCIAHFVTLVKHAVSIPTDMRRLHHY